ncbi:MAG: hypothetical protein LBU24_04595 [Methanocalculaceae archaeon]|nr:hypothetical protein [Methanocalculaceae archaeon]
MPAIDDERSEIITRSSKIENYPGFYQISGNFLMQMFADQTEEAGADIFGNMVTKFSH